MGSVQCHSTDILDDGCDFVAMLIRGRPECQKRRNGLLLLAVHSSNMESGKLAAEAIDKHLIRCSDASLILDKTCQAHQLPLSL